MSDKVDGLLDELAWTQRQMDGIDNRVSDVSWRAGMLDYDLTWLYRWFFVALAGALVCALWFGVMTSLVYRLADRVEALEQGVCAVEAAP